MTPHTLLLLAVLPFTAEPIPKEGDRPVAVLGDTSPGKNAKENAWFLQEHANLLKSRKVLEAALRRPGVAGLLPLGLEGDHIGWVQKRLKVEVEPKKNTFTVWVEVKDMSRRNQAALVNALVNEFMKEVAREFRHGKEQHIRRMSKNLDFAQQTLKVERQLYAADPNPDLARQIEMEEKGIKVCIREIERLREELRKPPRMAVLEKARAEP